MDMIKYDSLGIAVEQTSINNHPISYNPDDNRWYVHTAEGEVIATFCGDRKGFHNARRYARTH